MESSVDLIVIQIISQQLIYPAQNCDVLLKRCSTNPMFYLELLVSFKDNEKQLF